MKYQILKKDIGKEFVEIDSFEASTTIAAERAFTQWMTKIFDSAVWLVYLSQSKLQNAEYPSGYYFADSVVYKADGAVDLDCSDMACIITQKTINQGFLTYNDNGVIYSTKL